MFFAAGWGVLLVSLVVFRESVIGGEIYIGYDGKSDDNNNCNTAEKSMFCALTMHGV
jgi:hypothetical protein